MSLQTKTKLRKEILSKRQKLSLEEWNDKNNLICHGLKDLVLLQQSKTIFAYFSFRQEANLSPLFSLNKNWVFPRCVGKSLVWHQWQSEDALAIDKYGIQTPLETAPIVSVTTADLILVPTVACDRRGYRLGYGGGYYDRLLSSAEASGVSTIGIVFDFALVDFLPQDSWDIKLDFICTEKEFLTT